MDGKYEPKHLRQVKLSHEAQVERYVPALVSGCRLFRFHFGSSYSSLTPAVESDQLAPRPATQLWTMAPQLTTTEQSLIDDVVRKDGGTPMDTPSSQPAGPPAASQPAGQPQPASQSGITRPPGSPPEPDSQSQPISDSGEGGGGWSPKLFISSHLVCANLPINMTQTNDLVN